MKNEPRRRVETIFHASRERESGAEREAYLDGACGNDADLRSRVDALLAADDEATGFLEGSAVEGSPEGPGASIGNYKLLQEIGEGGMGVVYMAEQLKPVRRKVALKVIKLGMDTRQVIARFEAERQALAMMDHPHIARVLDAGSTDSGRPYFVMELVRGVPINEYCDTHKLPLNERLDLFIHVCHAVQHAHQKGIIHRDLKPTNVLVTSHDGTPVPKIIDFGVAKATNQRLTERTLFTEFHQIIGTPEYMSPEQAEMSGLDVDTRSDIYSLGVLLYQLLTGTTPVDPQELRTAGFEEMTRMIREDEAQVPSNRISTLGADADKIAKHRRSDAASLSRHFRGDLDWIVMKALEKDRTRRYETASAFAEDIVRHLEHRPVEAGPPGAMYRVRKFAYRNRRAVVASLILLAVLGLGLAGTTAGFLRARAEAERSGKVGDSLQDVLAMTNSALAADRHHMQEVLATVREVFGDDHATYAAVLDTLSGRLHVAGDFRASAELSRESLAVWKSLYGEQHPNVGITLGRLGSSLRAQGDDVQAESALRAALAILDHAPDAPGLARYDALVELADLLGNRGEYAEGDALLANVLTILRESPSPQHFRIIEILELRLMMQLNQPGADGLETIREVYEETHEFYPDDSPVVALAALGYGNLLFQCDDPEAAEPYLREAIQRFRAAPRPPRIYLFAALDHLFQIVRHREDPASILEADDLIRDTIEAGRDIMGLDALATNRAYYASRLVDRGRFADALDAMLDTHQAFLDADRSLADRHGLRDHLTILAFKAAIRPDLAPEVYDRALEAAERAVLEEPDNAAMNVALGAVLYRQGEFALAAETLALPPQPLSGSPGNLAQTMSPADHAFRALTHARLGDFDTAREELATLRAAFGGRGSDGNASALLREVEALIEPPPSSTEDG